MHVKFMGESSPIPTASSLNPCLPPLTSSDSPKVPRINQPFSWSHIQTASALPLARCNLHHEVTKQSRAKGWTCAPLNTSIRLRCVQGVSLIDKQ